MLTIEQTPTLKAHLAPKRTLRLNVVCTEVSSTPEALREATRLAADAEARIRVIVLRTVPYPLPLDTPPVAVSFDRKRVLRLVNENTRDASVIMCYCREEVDALLYLLESGSRLFRPDSIFVIAGRRRRWFPTRAQRIARKLEELGRHVVFVDGGKHV